MTEKDQEALSFLEKRQKETEEQITDTSERELELPSDEGKEESEEETGTTEVTDTNEAPVGLFDIEVGEEVKEEVVTPTKFDLSKYDREIFSTNTLSDTSLQELQKAKVPKEFIDSYVATKKALRESTIAALYQEAGGKEEYKSLLAWGSKNLTQSEATFYNSLLKSGEVTVIQNAIKALKATYVAKTGDAEVKQIRGNKPAPVIQNGFASKQEWMKDLSDPRYKKDPAFRQAVANKLAKSTQI
jgi:hypothetical protein